MNDEIVLRFEREMIEVVYEQITRLGYRAYLEVPCFERNVDLVVEFPEGLTAVECKLRDWKRGLVQARHHRIAFDYCFVCLPSRRITDGMLEAFHESGVGLFLLEISEKGSRLEEVIRAPRSTEKLQAVQDRILNLVREEDL